MHSVRLRFALGDAGLNRPASGASCGGVVEDLYQARYAAFVFSRMCGNLNLHRSPSPRHPQRSMRLFCPPVSGCLILSPALVAALPERAAMAAC